MANIEQTHLWSCCCSKHFTSINLLNPQNNAIRLSVVIIATLQVRKLKPGEIKSFAQGDKARKESGGSNPGSIPRDCIINCTTTLFGWPGPCCRQVLEMAL